MNSKCFIKNCTTTRSENITLFRATRKSGRLEKWKNILPSQDRELTEDCFICELHFEAKYVPRYVELRFMQGLDQFRKSQVGLTKGAIPTIFDEETVEKKRREIFTKNLIRNESGISLVLAQKENPVSNETPIELPFSSQLVFRSIENVPVLPYPKTQPTNEPILIENSSEPICVDLTEFDFDALKSEISALQLPFMWSYSIYRDLTVILINWDFTFSDVVKEIIITSNLNCRVFINKIPVTIESLPAIQNLASLKQIVEIVDLLPITGCGFISRKFGKTPSILTINMQDFYEAFKNKAKANKKNKQQYLHLR